MLRPKGLSEGSSFLPEADIRVHPGADGIPDPVPLWEAAGPHSVSPGVHPSGGAAGPPSLGRQRRQQEAQIPVPAPRLCRTDRSRDCSELPSSPPHKGGYDTVFKALLRVPCEQGGATLATCASGAHTHTQGHTRAGPEGPAACLSLPGGAEVDAVPWPHAAHRLMPDTGNKHGHQVTLSPQWQVPRRKINDPANPGKGQRGSPWRDSGQTSRCHLDPELNDRRKAATGVPTGERPCRSSADGDGRGDAAP